MAGRGFGWPHGGIATAMRRHAMKHLLLPLALLTATPLWAETCGVPEGPGRAIKAAKLFIEDNTGDGDIGVHGYFDDHGWTELCLFNPAGEMMLRMKPDAQMGALGMSEVFFESQEPGYDIWDFAALKAAWPEGQYTLRAQSHDGEILTGAALFTHNLPVPPVITSPALVPEPEDKPPVVAVGDVTVTWQRVTLTQDGKPVVLRGYQLWVNKDNHDDPNGFSRPNFDVHLSPDVTSFVVPAAFFDAGALYEVEVVAIEESGNQTIGGAAYFATE
jgi:hypothetical protein